jgi:hypothetical protein
MNDRLKSALEALKNLDQTLSPIELSIEREAALIQGLNGLANEYGKDISLTHIDSQGDMKFILTPADGSQTYGSELAEWLNMVPVKTGMQSIQGFTIPQHNWCRINHFEVERLLLLVDEKMNPNLAPTSRMAP